MIQIRPVSDLRNNFTELEKEVSSGQPVYLTKNGYGKMVLLSIEEYSRLIDQIEFRLDEAESTKERMLHDELFSKIRSKINE